MLRFHVIVATHSRRSPNFFLGLAPIPSSLSPNSFPLNSFADPHPLNPVTSILYKNVGGREHSQLSHRSPLSPIFRTFFQVPYPATPLSAALTKTIGVCTNNSHSGTHLLPDVHLSFQSLPRCPFCNPFLFTFMHGMGGVSPRWVSPPQPRSLLTIHGRTTRLSEALPVRRECIERTIGTGGPLRQTFFRSQFRRLRLRGGCDG
jgi:hypothetical protein